MSDEPPDDKNLEFVRRMIRAYERVVKHARCPKIRQRYAATLAKYKHAERKITQQKALTP